MHNCVATVQWLPCDVIFVRIDGVGSSINVKDSNSCMLEAIPSVVVVIMWPISKKNNKWAYVQAPDNGMERGSELFDAISFKNNYRLIVAHYHAMTVILLQESTVEIIRSVIQAE